MADKKISIGILGASGYGAGELLRLLHGHPRAEVVSLVSSSSVGASAADLHPQLAGTYSSLRCSNEVDYSALASGVIFAALPHGTSGSSVLALSRDARLTGAKIIDLSGDLRLHERELARIWYPETEFIDAERHAIAYGLPEINRDRIQSARIVANPGCLASAAILALAPLTKELSGEIIIDAKTGTSGAGRTPQSAFHHPAMHASMNAYKVLEHRHEAEIREVLGDPFEKRFHTSFVPHVIPTSRGIYVTCYLKDTSTRSLDSLREHYEIFYKNSPSVTITSNIPELRSVVGSNFCHIGLKKRGDRVVVFAALDNLIRGMAGVAVQNMNIACGFDEHLGLQAPGLGII